MSLDGAVAVVTGGSRGIGAAVARVLLRDGAKVYSLSRTIDDDAARLRDQGDYTWLAIDLADEEALNARIEEILADKRGVQILVNNAGITRDGLVFRMSRQDWDAVLALNLTATFLTCKIVARDMARRRAGSIINISSVVGLTGNPGQANYCASKAGIIGFSKSLAREVASRGVRVNVVAPGYIETGMTASLSDGMREKMTGMIPLGRTGTPEDVAGMVAFLASARSTYITGQVLQVDGGLLM
jgi:3-oxoacyl-[acyl-carrier protein] reductase